MIEIQVNGLIKSFEVGHNVLDGLSFQIDQGERVGLLGKNGAGKTTLFKILTGELDYDEGEVTVGQGRRVGLISQIPVYPDGYTVEDVLRSAFSRLHQLAEEMERLAEQTVLPEKVVLMNVETGWKEDSCEELQKQIYKYFGKYKLFGKKLPLSLEIVPVKEKNFDEGATRNAGVKRTTSPFLLFMKQDAIPADTKLIEELLWSMESGVGVSWARHVTGPAAGVLKTYINLYDYPSKSYTRTKDDISKYGSAAEQVTKISTNADKTKAVLESNDVDIDIKLLRFGEAANVAAADASSIASSSTASYSLLVNNYSDANKRNMGPAGAAMLYNMIAKIMVDIDLNAVAAPTGFKNSSESGNSWSVSDYYVGSIIKYWADVLVDTHVID